MTVDLSAWGSDLVLNTKTAPLPTGAATHDLTAAAGLLVSQADTKVEQEGANIKLGPAKVSIWTKNQGLRLLDDARGREPVRQPINGSLRGNDAAWAETTSTDAFQQDWQIRAFDAARGKTTLIADSAKLYPGVKNLRPAPGDTKPLIATDGTVYWEAAAPHRGGYRAEVLSRDLQARRPVRTVATNATLPRLAGNTVYYVRADDVSPETPQKVLEILAITPNGQRRRVVAAPLVKDQQVLAFAATKTHLVWMIGNTDRRANPPTEPDEGCVDARNNACSVFVLDLRTNTATRIVLHSAAVTLDLDTGLLGYAGTGQGDAGQYVFELASSRLWRVGESYGCGQTYVTQPYVSWYTPPVNGLCTGQVIVRWRTPR